VPSRSNGAVVADELAWRRERCAPIGTPRCRRRSAPGRVAVPADERVRAASFAAGAPRDRLSGCARRRRWCGTRLLSLMLGATVYTFRSSWWCSGRAGPGQRHRIAAVARHNSARLALAAARRFDRGDCLDGVADRGFASYWPINPISLRIPGWCFNSTSRVRVGGSAGRSSLGRELPARPESGGGARGPGGWRAEFMPRTRWARLSERSAPASGSFRGRERNRPSEC